MKKSTHGIHTKNPNIKGFGDYFETCGDYFGFGYYLETCGDYFGFGDCFGFGDYFENF